MDHAICIPCEERIHNTERSSKKRLKYRLKHNAICADILIKEKKILLYTKVDHVILKVNIC